MKKNVTELVFILDRSGSMRALETDTIGGFNWMLEKQKKQDGEANVTTVLFDDRYEIIHDRFPIETISPLTENEYYVRGCTALLDAVGKTIQKMATIQKHIPGIEKVIFVIITDGMENANREYGYDVLSRMIKEQKEEYGWEFLFLGANMDAVKEAGKFGISSDRSVTFQNDSQGVKMNYEVVDETITMMRKTPCMSDIGASWKKKIEDDFKRRKSNKMKKGTEFEYTLNMKMMFQEKISGLKS